VKQAIRRWLLTLAVWPLSVIDRRGFLKQMGWYRTVRLQRSIDAAGKPIPWWSYPFILFLQNRLGPQLKIFEYGSGNSTLWLARRVQSILSIETDPRWFARVRETLPPNVELKFQEYMRDGTYCRLIQSYPNQFDVVIVDAFDRVRCAQNSVSALTPAGVIIFDDAHQEHLQPGCQYLIERGFKRLDFFGPAPQSDEFHCTSVFYRPENCLGL
jgi:hypothetical protein